MGEPYVNRLFLDDHHRQLALWVEYKKLRSIDFTSNPEKARDMCSKLEHNLSVHFDCEEVLYSRYSSSGNQLPDLIKVVREDHRMMLKILAELNEGSGETEELINKFDKLLREHIIIEETKLYPALDAILDEKNRAEIIEDLKVHQSNYKA